MQLTVSKIAALALAVAYVIAAARQSSSFAATVALGVLIPLHLICFPEMIEEWMRRKKKGLHVKPSPPWLVAAMGWVFLVGLPLFVFLRRRS
jgi:hypothetical protein